MSDQEYERFRLAMGKPIVKMQRGHPTPRFKKLVQWVASLSEGEADACIRDYRSGQSYCCEAVNHFGGPTAVIQRAVKMRPVHRDWGRTS